MTIQLPDYEIGEVLGRGGMATIYRARHVRLDRYVALKVMHPELNRDDSFSERFLREAQIAANLNHANIVHVYDVNRHEDIHYIAMEVVDGGDLQERLKSTIERQELLAIVEQIAAALDYAHSKGYLHRDIKPANVLFRKSGEVLVSDFGIARALHSNTQLTQTGGVLGTPSYMSPEQARGEELDNRSDLYSVGIVLFEILTGKVPYTGDSSVSTAIKHITDPIPPLPEPIAAVQAFMDRALAKRANDRFASGAELIDSLRTSLNQITQVDLSATQTLLNIDTSLVTPHTNAAEAATVVSNPAASSVLVAQGPSRARAYASAIQVKLQQWRANLPWSNKTLGIAAALSALLLTGWQYFGPDPLSEEQKNKLTALYLAADGDIAAGRVYQPDGNNAVDRYKSALAIDADNDATLARIETLGARLEQQAKAAIAAQDWPSARTLTAQLARLLPEAKRPAELSERIAAAIAAAEAQWNEALAGVRQKTVAQNYAGALAEYKSLIKNNAGDAKKSAQLVSDVSGLAREAITAAGVASKAGNIETAEELLNIADTAATLGKEQTVLLAVGRQQSAVAQKKENLAAEVQQKKDELAAELKAQQRASEGAKLLGRANQRASQDASAQEKIALYQKVLDVDPKQTQARTKLAEAVDSRLSEAQYFYDTAKTGPLAKALAEVNGVKRSHGIASNQRQKYDGLNYKLNRLREQDKEIAGLMGRFDRYMVKPRLRSAGKIYKRMVAANPKESRLLPAAQRLAAGYFNLAREEAARSDWKGVRKQTQLGLQYRPDHSGLKNLLAQAEKNLQKT